MERKRAPDAAFDGSTEVERLPSAPFVSPVSGTFEAPWLGGNTVRGELVDGRYELGERIRVGPTGDLFAATHLALGRRVAIQVLRAERARDPELRQRFERGALALAAVEHANVVRVFDLGLGDQPFVVLELPAGPSVAGLLARHGPLDPTRAVRIALQLAAALRAAHAHGVVHGDVRADNVVVSPREDDVEVPKWVGFELAQTSEHAHDVHDDLYGLVTLLRQMLVGRDPRAFDRDRLRAQLGRHRTPVSADRLHRVIERGLALPARSRYQSAAQLEEALCAVVSPGRWRPRGRARSIVRFLLISLAAIVISALIAFLWARRETTDHPAELRDARRSGQAAGSAVARAADPLLVLGRVGPDGARVLRRARRPARARR
jgi:hypothetical protein